MAPIKYPREPLLDREGLKGRPIGPPRTAAWTEPVFMEWELSGQSWTDEHPHAEYVFVLEGHLFVESGGVTVECFPGDLAQVPPGVIGTYRAPEYARMMSIYGPNPEGHETKFRGLVSL